MSHATGIEEVRADLRRDWRYRFWEAVWRPWYALVVWWIKLTRQV